MAEFLIEIYVTRDGETAAQRHAERARRAAAELTSEGTPVCCRWSAFVPEDETCFLLYEAPSLAAVEEAARRADLRCDHISGAVWTPLPEAMDGGPAGPRTHPPRRLRAFHLTRKA
jgi:hypothetical protein